MNIEFEKQFGREIKLIPLKDKANIMHGNAARIDWQDICTNKPKLIDANASEQVSLIEEPYKQKTLPIEKELRWEEIYMISNPPYLGSSFQDKSQKEDMGEVFSDFKNYKNLDYISIWFKKGVDYIGDSEAQLAFVSTNSIVQGEQVGLLWPYILSQGKEIGFAFSSFKWENSAINNAGVACVVINLRNKSSKQKYIYGGVLVKEAVNINPYLVEANNVVLPRRRGPISNLPVCIMGSKPTDGGFLILDNETYDILITQYPEAAKFIKRYVGSDDYINNKLRYCLWIEDNEIEEARAIPSIKSRLDSVKQFRLASSTESTQEYANFPNRFRQRAYQPTQAIIIPTISSERRDYWPIGYIDRDKVVSNAANVIYDAPLYVFSIVSSRMHLAWVRISAGKLKTDSRYSPTLSYNNFPLRALSDTEKQELGESAKSILFARENHTEKTIAEMYDPDKMPDDLKKAHYANDLLVDKLYRLKPYNNDEERLSDLFALYEQMLETEG